MNTKEGKTTVTVQWPALLATEEERETFEAGRDGMKQGWRGRLINSRIV